MCPAPEPDHQHHPRLSGLLAQRGLPQVDIEAFLAAQTTPLVEPGAVTFLYCGDAERVELLRWIHAGVDRTDLQLLEDFPLWQARLPVEDGGRFEYKLCVTRGGHENWILDPYNPARAGDPFGENSVCRTFGYERPAWSLPQGAPAGRLETIEVASAEFGETRREGLYLPVEHDAARPYPLIVVHDGEDFLNYADLHIALDNLIDAGDIPPVIAVLIQTKDRMDEYARGRRHARYIVHELLPALESRYPLATSSADRVLLGASLGAVASLATSLRFPGAFGGMVLKSGSFVLDAERLAARSHPVFHRVSRLLHAMQRAPRLPQMRAFVSTGELEGLAEDNRELADILRERGVDVRFKRTFDGHHWHNWRDQLRGGLMWVLRREA